jgi:hypothetical protein
MEIDALIVVNGVLIRNFTEEFEVHEHSIIKETSVDLEKTIKNDFTEELFDFEL